MVPLTTLAEPACCVNEEHVLDAQGVGLAQAIEEEAQEASKEGRVSISDGA